MGTTFAPNLQDRFNGRVGYARFIYVLHHGFHGGVGVMPSFEKNEQVLAVTDALYAYLRARAGVSLPLALLEVSAPGVGGPTGVVKR